MAKLNLISYVMGYGIIAVRPHTARRTALVPVRAEHEVINYTIK